jgi:hypothetical protein
MENREGERLREGGDRFYVFVINFTFTITTTTTTTTR